MKNLKRVTSIFLCTMLILMVSPLITQAANSSWWRTTISFRGDSSISDSFYCEKGAITCDYQILQNTVKPINNVTFILQTRDKNNQFIWNDRETKTISMDSYNSITKGSIIFNKYKGSIDKICRVVVMADNPMNSGYANVSYYGNAPF
ncbi:MAG: hypothetical protein H2184_04175 [Candidatus Galacturonibacter soehngenii]|nr:hypothetical protein [Candidatus Galacturonibacter soehngenii]